MKKLFTLAALSGLGLFTIGCGEPAAAPVESTPAVEATPADPMADPAAHGDAAAPATEGTEGAAPATEGAAPATEGAAPATEGAAPATEGAAPATEGEKPAE